MRKKLLGILLTLVLCVAGTSTMLFASAAAVTGSETDRNKIGEFWSNWNSGAWSTVITEAYVEEYERLESIGFDPGTASDKVAHWEIGFKQEFVNGDGTYEAWGHAGRSCIMFYNALKDTAYSMYNDPYEVWMTGTNKDTLLMPTSNQFTIAGDVYQNFARGYTKNKTLVAGKNVKDIETAVAFEEITLTKAQQYAHTYTNEIWNNLGGKQLRDVAGKVSEAIFALEATGFDVGTASKDGVKVWDTQQPSGKIIIADMSRSDSNMYIWSENDGRNAMAMYNPNLNKAFIIYDEMANKYIQFKLTTPKSDMFISDNVKYQNFTNGYIKVTEGTAEFVMKRNFDETSKTEINALELSDIGVFDGADVTDAEIKTLVSSQISTVATEKSPGVPAGYVAAVGENVFAQYFNDAVVFVNVTEEDSVYTASAIYFDGDIFTAYNTRYGFNVPEDELGATPAIRLGNPVAAAFDAGTKTFINFDRGCIVYDGTAAEVKTGYRAKTDGTLEDLVFDSVAFIGNNFTLPSNVTITQDQLIEKFNAKYQSLMTGGYNLGAPDDGGITLWAKSGYVAGAALNPGDGWIKQGFVGGSGEGFSFGVTSYLIYNISKNEVYLIRDYVQNQVQYILFDKGAPTADTLDAVDGIMKQQFEKGYINAMETWGQFMFFDGMNIGDPIDDDDDDDDKDKKGCKGAVAFGDVAGLGLSALIFTLFGAGLFVTLRRKTEKK